MNFYSRVIGDIRPGHLARSSDVNMIQTHIEDMSKLMWNKLQENDPFIVGSDEYAFLLTPATKRGKRYVDTMNITNEVEWLSFNKHTLKQPIHKTKSSCYSIMLNIRNADVEDREVHLELKRADGRTIPDSRKKITISKETPNGEWYEVIFNIGHLAVAHGRDPEQIEVLGDMHLQPNTDDFYIDNQPIDKALGIKGNSTGTPSIYLVINALGLSLDDNLFAVEVDKSGGYPYGKLATKGIGTPDSEYQDTIYSLMFKDIYANNPTYLCEFGEAVIDGDLVQLNDTHISIDGASTYGDTKTYVTMDKDGFLNGYTSPAYTNIDDVEIPMDVMPNQLLIGIITTYMNDVKSPKIEQDDTNLITRMRSHHERLRRLEKEMKYQRDITIPPRMKYVLSGLDIITNNLKDISVTSGDDLWKIEDSVIEPNNTFLTTDEFGNPVIKSTQATVINIPATFKGSQTTNNKTGEDLGKVIANHNNVSIDKTNGIVQLSTRTVKSTKDEKETSNIKYSTGVTKKEAKNTLNIWDDYKANRHKGTIDKDDKITRKFTVDKDKVGRNAWSSEFPAMTFYVSKPFTLHKLTVPVVRFKNCSHVIFEIWERQTSNNKKNTVWLKRKLRSKKYSLKHAKVKDNIQTLSEPITIDLKAAGKSLYLDKAQYIVLVLPVPKSGKGSVYIYTYKPQGTRDFLIRYYGSADASHFLLKDRYFEVWYDPIHLTGSTSTSQAEVAKTEYVRNGFIESGEVVWNDNTEEPIASVSYDINATTDDGCGYAVSVNAGNGWVKLPNENTAVNIVGGQNTFKWRIDLTSNGEGTPKIKYNSNQKYAINFTITKQAPHISGDFNKLENEFNEVITTQTLYPGDILNRYINDGFFDGSSRFSNYEWLRLWARDSDSHRLICDIQASDVRSMMKSVDGRYELVDTINSRATRPRTYTKNGSEYTEVDMYTLHYADLTLDDFTRDSVDYSNYDPDLEYDEHNLRFKIDTDQSYNDDNIVLYNNDDITFIVESQATADGTTFTYGNESVDNVDDDGNVTSTNMKALNIPTNYTSNENEILLKFTNTNRIDLSNYSALKLSYALNGSSKSSTISGLGLYISQNIEEEAPTLNDDVELSTTTLPEVIDPNDDIENIIESWVGKVFKESYQDSYTGATGYAYYEYKLNGDGVYKKQQYHNVNSYTLFKLPPLTANNQVLIPIDKYNENFQNIKEIGLITLVGDGIEFNISGATKTDETNSLVKVQDLNNSEMTYYTYTSSLMKEPPLVQVGDNDFVRKSDTSDTPGVNYTPNSYNNKIVYLVSQNITHFKYVDAGLYENEVKQDVRIYIATNYTYFNSPEVFGEDKYYKFRDNNQDRYIPYHNNNDANNDSTNPKLITSYNPNNSVNNRDIILTNVTYDNKTYYIYPADLYDAVLINADWESPTDGLTLNGNNWNLVIKQIKSVAEGFNTIFDGSESFIPYQSESNRPDGKYLMNNTYLSNGNKIFRLNIYPANLADDGEILCYWTNNSITTDFNHFAIQMIADNYIPKNALKINFCSDLYGRKPIESLSLNVPTLNYIFYEATKEYRGTGISNFVWTDLVENSQYVQNLISYDTEESESAATAPTETVKEATNIIEAWDQNVTDTKKLLSYYTNNKLTAIKINDTVVGYDTGSASSTTSSSGQVASISSTKVLMNAIDGFLAKFLNDRGVDDFMDLQTAFDAFKVYGLSPIGKAIDTNANFDLIATDDNSLYPRKYVVKQSKTPTEFVIVKKIKKSSNVSETSSSSETVDEDKGNSSTNGDMNISVSNKGNGYIIEKTYQETIIQYTKQEKSKSKEETNPKETNPKDSNPKDDNPKEDPSGSSSSSGSNSSKSSYTKTTTKKTHKETITISYDILKYSENMSYSEGTSFTFRNHKVSNITFCTKKYQPKAQDKITIDELFTDFVVKDGNKTKTTKIADKELFTKDGVLANDKNKDDAIYTILERTRTKGEFDDYVKNKLYNVERLEYNDEDDALWSYLFSSYRGGSTINKHIDFTYQGSVKSQYKGLTEAIAIKVTFYEDIIELEDEKETSKPEPKFSQIFKKINDDKTINSISISTTEKFKPFMEKIMNANFENERRLGLGGKSVLTIFIDDIVLHEAEHIPLFHPNVRLKLYSEPLSSSVANSTNKPSIRKFGAVIEYR